MSAEIPDFSDAITATGVAAAQMMEAFANEEVQRRYVTWVRATMDLTGVLEQDEIDSNTILGTLVGSMVAVVMNRD